MRCKRLNKIQLCRTTVNATTFPDHLIRKTLQSIQYVWENHQHQDQSQQSETPWTAWLEWNRFDSTMNYQSSVFTNYKTEDPDRCQDQSKISSLTCQCCTARILKSTTITICRLTISSNTICNPTIWTICWKDITSCCTFRIALATTIPCFPSTLSKWCSHWWSSPSWAEILVEWYSSVITTRMTNRITIVDYRSVQIKRIVWTYSMDRFDRLEIHLCLVHMLSKLETFSRS